MAMNKERTGQGYCIYLPKNLMEQARMVSKSSGVSIGKMTAAGLAQVVRKYQMPNLRKYMENITNTDN